MPDELDLTLTQLEGSDWGPPEFKSHLVAECHRLRNKRLRDFTIEDLRIMIGQDIGLRYLIPIVIRRLSEDALAEGAFYPGDLLGAVLRIDSGYWGSHHEERETAAAIAERATESLAEAGEEAEVPRKALQDALAVFRTGDGA